MSKLMEMIEKIKREADPAKVGMIACHNGLVRSTSRGGEPAEYLEIDVDPEAWQRVLDEMRTQPGIAAIEAHLFTGRRKIGDDVLLVAVAGDIRENVFPVLEGVVNKMKAQAIIKREKLFP